jgi:hypothetical protein
MSGGSPAQHPRATATLGAALGVAFAVCFVTGLVSEEVALALVWAGVILTGRRRGAPARRTPPGG